MHALSYEIIIITKNVLCPNFDHLKLYLKQLYVAISECIKYVIETTSFFKI